MDKGMGAVFQMTAMGMYNCCKVLQEAPPESVDDADRRNIEQLRDTLFNCAGAKAVDFLNDMEDVLAGRKEAGEGDIEVTRMAMRVSGLSEAHAVAIYTKLKGMLSAMQGIVDEEEAEEEEEGGDEDEDEDEEEGDGEGMGDA